jgi:hypothetical protein
MAYNALPGTFSADMWAHQYDQQPNQILCTLHQRDWTDNGPESNLFGLAPNYGCCTSNFHQGWPKFAASVWMATADDGLAAVAYGPSEVHSTVRGGVRVSIVEDTEYPFRGRIHLTVRPERDADFPLAVRIPKWAEGATVAVEGLSADGVQPGEFYTIDRLWRSGDVVELMFPMRLRVSRSYRDSAVIERGPLVYSLKIGEEWKKLRDRTPAADWEVYPTSPWNYGLALDPAKAERSIKVREKPVGDYPFSAGGAPVELAIRGRRIPEWKMENGSAAAPPASPVGSTEPLEPLTLIPYGSAKLRITTFPLLTD